MLTSIVTEDAEDHTRRTGPLEIPGDIGKVLDVADLDPGKGVPRADLLGLPGHADEITGSHVVARNVEGEEGVVRVADIALESREELRVPSPSVAVAVMFGPVTAFV